MASIESEGLEKTVGNQIRAELQEEAELPLALKTICLELLTSTTVLWVQMLALKRTKHNTVYSELG